MSRAPRLRDEPAAYGILNQWNDDVSSQLDNLGGSVARLEHATGQTNNAVSGLVVDNTVPPDPTIVATTVTPVVVDTEVYNIVNLTYTAPTPLKGFAGIFVVVTGYNGSATPFKVGESNYAGAPGGTGTAKVILARTGETINVYYVSKNASEVSRDTWTAAPFATVTLNAYPTASIPSGVTATADALGVRVSWTDVGGANTLSFNVYRNTVNNPATASKIAALPSNGIAGQTYFDKSASVNVLYFYWVTSVMANGGESGKSSAVSSAGLGPGTHSSYRPLSNPLTATDAGATATINVASFTMRIGGLDLTYNSGSIASLSYSTVYYIYLLDTSFVGGGVTYLATTTKETILNNYGQLFVGSIRTPVATGSNTVGNNDGGAGAQVGNVIRLAPGQYATAGGVAVTTTPEKAIDGDSASKGTWVATSTGASASETSSWGLFPSFTQPWKALTLNVKSQVTANTTTAAPAISKLVYYSSVVGSFVGIGLPLGGNTIWSVNPGITRALTTDTISLPLTQNTGQVLMQLIITTSNTAGEHTNVDMYDMWIEGTL